MLERQIQGSAYTDATGLRPYFFCDDWHCLARDIQTYQDRWISVVVATDPFAEITAEELQKCFDQVSPYKKAYVADLQEPIEKIVTKSHRGNARRAMNKISVEVCNDAADYLDDWILLFNRLKERHSITGIDAYSDESFVHQLRAPGMVAFRGFVDTETVALDLWCRQGNVAHAHLVAMSDEGYRLGASYATKSVAMRYFQESGVRFMNFGALPGSQTDETSGLGHFKAGWSNIRRENYLCTLVCDPEVYKELSAQAAVKTPFFPSYRAGETN